MILSPLVRDKGRPNDGPISDYLYLTASDALLPPFCASSTGAVAVAGGAMGFCGDGPLYFSGTACAAIPTVLFTFDGTTLQGYFPEGHCMYLDSFFSY